MAAPGDTGSNAEAEVLRSYEAVAGSFYWGVGGETFSDGPDNEKEAPVPEEQ